MERIDLEKPMFTQAQVLRMIPALKAKALRNWQDRDIFDNFPSKKPRAKVRYTPIGVIVLAFMANVIELGVGPSDAYEMAKQIAERANILHTEYPAEERDGRLNWVINVGNAEFYHRGYITGGKTMQVHDDDGFKLIRHFYPKAYITVEVDFLIFQMLNRIYIVHTGGLLDHETNVPGNDKENTQ